MEAFSNLCQRLESAYTAEQQVKVLTEGLPQLADLEFAWTVFWLMGYRLKRLVSRVELQAFAMQNAQIDEVLFNESLAHIRDFPETIALLCAGGQVETQLSLLTLVDLHLHALRTIEHDEFWMEIRHIYTQLAVGPARIWTAMLLGRPVIGDYKPALFTSLAKLYQKEPVLLQLFLAEKWRPQASFRQDLMEQVPDLRYRQYFQAIQQPERAPLGTLPKMMSEESTDWIVQPLVGGLLMQLRRIEDKVWLFDGEAVWPGDLLIPEWSPQAFQANYTYVIILRQTENSANYQNAAMVWAALANHFRLRHKKQPSKGPLFECWCVAIWETTSTSALKIVSSESGLSQPMNENAPNWQMVETQSMANTGTNFPKHWFKGPLKGVVVHQLTTGKMVQYGIQRHRLRLILLYFKRGFGPDGIEELTFGVYQTPQILQQEDATQANVQAESPAFVPLWRLTVTPELAQVQNLRTLLQEHIIERFGPVRSVKPVFIVEVSFTGVVRSKRHKAGIQLVDAILEQWLGEANETLRPNALADCQQWLNP